MLGTGAAVPLSRGLPCNVLRVDNQIYVFDVGEGCQERMLSSGLGIVKVKAIFITHLHGDHYLGLFGMLQSMHMLDRKSELEIIAPSSLNTILETIFKYSTTKPRFPITFTEVTRETTIYSDNKINVDVFPVNHGIESWGYRINVGGRKTIVYTGDTRPIDNVVEYSRSADLLIHEATFTSDRSEEAFMQGHSTAADAGKIAAKAKVKRLVLTHISARYSNEQLLFYDAYRFHKNVVVANDYMVLII